MSTTFAEHGSTSEDSGIQSANISCDSSVKPTSTKPNTRTSIVQTGSTSRQNQKPPIMGSGHDLHVLVPARMGSSDSPPSGLKNHTHDHSCANDQHQGSCRARCSLAQLQEQSSLYRADSKTMLASQETKHKRDAEVAQSLGFDLPKPSAEDFTTMTPMERYKEEQKCGMGPWTAESRRG